MKHLNTALNKIAAENMRNGKGETLIPKAQYK